MRSKKTGRRTQDASTTSRIRSSRWRIISLEWAVRCRSNKVRVLRKTCVPTMTKLKEIASREKSIKVPRILSSIRWMRSHLIKLQLIIVRTKSLLEKKTREGSQRLSPLTRVSKVGEFPLTKLIKTR